MKAKHLFFILPLLVTACFSFETCIAQVEVEDAGTFMFRNDSTGRYYKSRNDSGYIVFYCPGSFCYKKINKKGIVVIEGDLVSTCIECRKKQGEWKEYFDDGKLKSVRHYCYGNEVGEVCNYYSNGKIKEKYDLAFIEDAIGRSLFSGVYQEYFPSGKQKTIGYYKLKIDSSTIDTLMLENIETGEITMRLDRTSKPISAKWGTWKFFNEKGKLLKKEEYR